MKRKGYISPHIETKRNFELAFDGFSEHKKARITVRKFEEDLDGNLAALLEAYLTENWRTSPYTDKRIFDRKNRIVSKLPIQDHVIQWAYTLNRCCVTPSSASPVHASREEEPTTLWTCSVKT